MRVVVLVGLTVGLLGVPAGAVAQAVACTDTATVTWETNGDDLTVEAAHVEVPGCPEGSEVGIQLLTDDGHLPANPIVGVVDDEHVRFDLTSLDVRVQPVTGVRVLVHGDVLVELVDIIVEQRFHSQSGNEQRGLRRPTELEVPVDGQYQVPGAPTRYTVAACADMRRWSPPTDLVGQGAGTFTATEAGRHVVCYQQRPGTPGGSPDTRDPTVPEPDVLDKQLENPGPGVEADAAGADSGTRVLGRRLPRTGADLFGLGALAILLVVAGHRLVVVRRH